MSDSIAWRRAGHEDRGLAVLLAIAGAGAATLLPFAPRFAPAAPACVFHALTGVPCPGCGTTRALVALAGGDAWSALLLNPLATLATLVGFAVAALAVPWVAARGPLPVLTGGGLPRPARVAAVGAVGLQWLWLVARGV